LSSTIVLPDSWSFLVAIVVLLVAAAILEKAQKVFFFLLLSAITSYYYKDIVFLVFVGVGVVVVVDTQCWGC
jgi:hypothetical protein